MKTTWKKRAVQTSMLAVITTIAIGAVSAFAADSTNEVKPGKGSQVVSTSTMNTSDGAKGETLSYDFVNSPPQKLEDTKSGSIRVTIDADGKVTQQDTPSKVDGAVPTSVTSTSTLDGTKGETLSYDFEKSPPQKLEGSQKEGVLSFSAKASSTAPAEGQAPQKSSIPDGAVPTSVTSTSTLDGTKGEVISYDFEKSPPQKLEDTKSGFIRVTVGADGKITQQDTPSKVDGAVPTSVTSTSTLDDTKGEVLPYDFEKSPPQLLEGSQKEGVLSSSANSR